MVYEKKSRRDFLRRTAVHCCRTVPRKRKRDRDPATAIPKTFNPSLYDMSFFQHHVFGMEPFTYVLLDVGEFLEPF